MRKKIDHWCSVVPEKSQPSGPPFSGKLGKPRFPLEQWALRLGFFCMVCEKKNRSLVFSGSRKNPNPRVHRSVGNSASLVSHWNGGPSGWDFSVWYVRKRIDHWCSVVPEKSQPSGPPFSGKLGKPRFPLERWALRLGFFCPH